MTVGDLVKELSKLDPSLPVVSERLDSYGYDLHDGIHIATGRLTRDKHGKGQWHGPHEFDEGVEGGEQAVLIQL